LDIFDLKVTQRNTFGKGPARTLRREGMVPAVLYGPQRKSLPLSVSPLELKKIYKTSGSDQVILNLMIENGGTKNVTAMVRELQTSPVSREYLHVDFFEISLDKEIVVSVAVEVTGKSKGVERGGLLQVVRHELEISCLPRDLPDNIELDVTDLDIGDALHVGDIVLGEGIKLLADPSLTVLTVGAPAVEEAAVPEEELAEAAEEAEKAEGGEAEGAGEASE
jgi:large subunit ribosomal protein L25